jgi:DNA-binding MarR family transcriptional regulator
MKTHLDLISRAIEQVTQMIARMESDFLHEGDFSDLSMRQVVLIETIGKMEHPSLSDVANQLGISKPSVTVGIAKLVQKGYLRKDRSSEDNRVYRLSLSGKGLNLRKMHDNIHQAIADTLTRRLSPEEIQQLIVLFHKILETR